MNRDEICKQLVKLGYNEEMVAQAVPEWWTYEMWDNFDLRFEFMAKIARIFILNLGQLSEGVFEPLELTQEQWREWHKALLRRIYTEDHDERVL